MKNKFDPYLISLLRSARPAAVATMKGSAEYPQIRGRVTFYALPGKTLVVTELVGLPKPKMPGQTESGEPDERCADYFFGIHIHEGVSCTPVAATTASNGSPEPAFNDAGGHLNPYHCPHPGHLGDMPALLADNGEAISAFVTSRFTPAQLIGHAVVLHRMSDDFHTQPAGDSGERIACGLIRRI